MEVRLKIALYTLLVVFNALTFGGWGVYPVLAISFVMAIPVVFMLTTLRGFYNSRDDLFWSKKGNLKVFGYYDKLEHGLFYVPLIFAFVTLMYWLSGLPFNTVWQINASIATFVLGICKELFDSSYYANKIAKGILRGDGFSFKDVIANTAGIIIINIGLIIFL